MKLRSASDKRCLAMHLAAARALPPCPGMGNQQASKRHTFSQQVGHVSFLPMMHQPLCLEGAVAEAGRSGAE